ncbi:MULTISPECIES: hypothetical protein [unclassified Moorena]|nr:MULTISPECIES: hypothetical protein [unclassified Moorena]NEO13879.1 hypothetical protein [Moorena sp. SIO3E8]NEQ00271.1 hypothetical protein [Moorena sp. SIO3F7]
MRSLHSMFNSVFRDILPTLTSPNAGFLPTPPNGIGFRRRWPNGYRKNWV